MKITKFGHCCFLVEEGGLRILTDPGIYSDQQNELKDIDFILITHDHTDHLHVDSLKEVLKNNPRAKVITNQGVGLLLQKENIPFDLLEDSQKLEVGGVLLEGFGQNHTLIHSSIPLSANTGYFIANKLFYPGDAFINPHRPVEILALPVAGPWLTLANAIDYALELKPKTCFPVHEGILKSPGTVHRIPPLVLEPTGIKFVIFEPGKEYEF
ncbi:MAG: MBL fold metallo-hydrolase [Candidatus Paceibacterota bacterium]|jgi:L-ascorbate metabolism protein UlaG (beta-lactamase superfamily)